MVFFQELYCFTPSVDSSKYPLERREEEGTLEACKIPYFLTNFYSDWVENSPAVNLDLVQNSEKERPRDFHIIVLNKYLNREFNKYLRVIGTSDSSISKAKTLFFPLELMFQFKSQQTFSVKNQRVNILGFVCGHVPYKTFFTKASGRLDLVHGPQFPNPYSFRWKQND